MKLSILIAAYNVEKFIDKCIQSCYDDSLSSLYEIIVVNDGSTDNTLPIIEDLKTKISNLKVINKENQGLGAARNTAIEHALGEYIWMIDGDDYLETYIIPTILDQLSSKNDCYGINFNLVKENGDFLCTKYLPNYITKVYTGSEFYNHFYYDSYTWQFIFKRELFSLNNLNFKERINMQDSEIFPKIMYYTKSIKYIDIIAYNYVQQENSFTNTINSSKRIKYFESIIEVKNSLVEFSEFIKDKDKNLDQGIQKKLKAIDQIIFNHLVFYKYSPETFKGILKLLKEYNLYPLTYKPSGKLKLIKLGLNISPLITKKIIDLLR